MADKVLSGAAEGAAKGFAIGGPIGGLVGGIFGGIGGIFSNKAAKYKRKANKEEQISVEIQQAAQRRNLIRSAYLARSEAVAAAGAQETGGLASSAPAGAISSIGTQAISNLKFFDALIARQIMANYYRKKAGKNAGYAATVGAAGTLALQTMGGFSSGVKPGDATEAGNYPNPMPSTSGEFPV